MEIILKKKHTEQWIIAERWLVRKRRSEDAVEEEETIIVDSMDGWMIQPQHQQQQNLATGI